MVALLALGFFFVAAIAFYVWMRIAHPEAFRDDDDVRK
jgi:hypothetical protein